MLVAGNFYVIKTIPVQVMSQMIIGFKSFDYISTGERIGGCVVEIRESLMSKYNMLSPDDPDSDDPDSSWCEHVSLNMKKKQYNYRLACITNFENWM